MQTGKVEKGKAEKTGKAEQSRRASKTAKQMERHLKGMANHHRIAALLLIAARGPLTLEDIVAELDANEKTLGEHVRRLHVAGLVNKQYRGKFVEHTLSPYGRLFSKFLESFRHM